MLENRAITDLVRIAAAGGGFVIDVRNRSTDDLVRIAAATRSRGAKITFLGLDNRTTPDLVRIAAAGGGNIVFS
jgi:hypothetical protein